MTSLSIIIHYFKITRASLLNTFLLILSALLSDGPYIITSYIFSYLIAALTKNDRTQVLFFTLLYFGLKILSKIARIFNYHFEKKFYNQVYTKLQTTMASRLEHLHFDDLSHENKNKYLNIVSQDIKELADFGTWLSSALLLFSSFVISAIIILRIHVLLMFLGILVSGIVILLLNHYNQLYEIIIKNLKSKSDQEMGFFSQLLQGFMDIKIFDILTPLKKRYETYNQAYIKIHNQQVNNQIIKNILSPSITMITEIILVIYSIYGYFQGDFGIETVLIINQYFGTLFSALTNFTTTLGKLRLIQVSIDRYEDYLKVTTPTNHYGHKQLTHIQGEITFEDVSIGYGKHPILNHFNGKISPHTLTAIIGKSGSGKSTLGLCLLRFLRPTSGKIFIDNQNIQHIDPEYYPSYISAISQDPFIFHLSFYENLALIDPNFDHIQEACRRVQLHDYILSLPQGYDTLLNDNASDLSGGQKQRLAIARVLLKKTPIILFDEMTSALDEELSDDILHIIEDLKQDHTIIMITHKANEYQKADQIISLNKITAH